MKQTEEFIQNKLSHNEISETKTYIIDFDIEFLDQIKSRFDFYLKDLGLLNIITLTNVQFEKKAEIQAIC